MGLDTAKRRGFPESCALDAEAPAVAPSAVMKHGTLAWMRLVAVTSALAACGGDDTSAFAPEGDASAADVGTPDDVTTTVDAVVDVPRVDTGAVDRPGTDGQGVCPASCTSTADCAPCRTPDQPSTVQYCCISGLCISMTSTCATVPTDAPSPDALGDGAGAEAATSDGATGLDDVTGPGDDASTPPDDVPVKPPADAGSDDLGGAAGDAGDAGASGDAPRPDASAAMDAAG